MSVSTVNRNLKVRYTICVNGTGGKRCTVNGKNVSKQDVFSYFVTTLSGISLHTDKFFT
jgi:hypothetical protein